MYLIHYFFNTEEKFQLVYSYWAATTLAHNFVTVENGRLAQIIDYATNAIVGEYKGME